MNLVRILLNITSISIPTQWEMTKTKKIHILQNPECAICGYTKHLNSHHIVPVHIDPLLACDPNNLITLCRSCHFTFGHYHNFRKYWNPNIKSLAIDIKDAYDYTFISTFINPN